MEFAVDQPEATINTEMSPAQSFNPLSQIKNNRTEDTPRDADPQTDKLSSNPYRKNLMTEPDKNASASGVDEDQKTTAESKMTL